MREARVYELGVDSAEGEYAGFDPNNVRDIKNIAFKSDGNGIKPMGYFAMFGDLPMMRWLYINGADTQDEHLAFFSPMLLAIQTKHCSPRQQLKMCQWLCDHGAAEDVKRNITDGLTSLDVTSLAFLFSSRSKRNLSRWLMLNGALCKDDASGDLDVATLREDLGQVGQPAWRQERKMLLKWAKEHHQSRSLFGVFLMGTLSPHVYSVTKLRKALLVRTRSEEVVDVILQAATPGHCHLLWDGLFPRRVCPLAVFAGKSGILELMGGYTGHILSRETRIVRQLTELLPGVIAELDRRGPRRQKDAADELRRRLLDAGSPVEDDETARQKMRDAEVYERGVVGAPGEYVGFNPKNVADVKSVCSYGMEAMTPMGYFAMKGDLPMMRWLYANGANTQDNDADLSGFNDADRFPMRMAAVHGRFEACKWLFHHGAAKDVKRRTPTDGTERAEFSMMMGRPAHWYPNGKGLITDTLSFSLPPYRKLSQWLTLKGALCKDDDSGDLDIARMRKDLGQVGQTPVFRQERKMLLKWAKEHHQSRSLFGVFLMGTLSPPAYSVTILREELLARFRSEGAVDLVLHLATPDHYQLLWDGLFPRPVCPLAPFAGESGILELIGDCVGIMRGREARIVRQLTELLPGVIAELDRRRPDHDANIDESSSDSSDSN